jgi:predicted DNA-binding transcriptional regulator AlpA
MDYASMLVQQQECTSMQQDITVNFPDSLIDEIAQRVLEKLLPHLQTQSPDEILTVEEVARLIKKSKEQIYQWSNQSRHGLGDFPYEKAGKSLRFSKRKVLEWMQKNAKR